MNTQRTKDLPASVSRLKPPSKIKIPTQVNPNSSNMENLRKNGGLSNLPARLALSRRSKSFSDIRTLAKSTPVFKRPEPLIKPKVLSQRPIPSSKVNKAPVSSLGKRPAPTKPEGDTKPKVARPAKPAPYDYKARFNLLNEKYTVLVEKNRESVRQLNEISEEGTTLKTENTSLKEKCKEFENVSQELKVVKKQLQELEHELKDVFTKYTDLRKEHAELEKTHNELETTTKCLRREHETLKDNYDKATVTIREQEKAIEVYKADLESCHENRRMLHNMIQDLKGNIRVFCRVRPPKCSEEDRLLLRIAIPDETALEIRKSKESVSTLTGKMGDLVQEFNFDRVFDPRSTQSDVFEDLSQLVQSALDGYNICVFAYGQTGSGKTYTMQGTMEDLGMIPRTIQLLFNKIQGTARYGWSYHVSVSFLEIYNETIKDLLNPDSGYTHEIKFNEGKGTTVTNLLIEEIETFNDYKRLMEIAHRNRATAATDFNEHSSRSHAVTKFSIEGYHADSQLKLHGSLNLVDLAGSESAKTSDRLVETKNINKSLSALGSVMMALHNRDNHIPYRNSKLTYLLQSSLGGNSKTLMFVNIAPFEECYNETVSSLRFAAKVKEVKIKSRRNRLYT